MMRFTIIAVAFLIIIHALKDDHILVYAHEGGDAGHKSLDYRGDKDSHDFTSTGAPRKLRPGRTMRTTVVIAEKEKVRATNNHDLSIKISSGASKQLKVERKLGFHKRSKSSSFKWKPKKKKPSGRFVAFYDDYRGPARHPPRHNL
ncbi:BnaAnng07860D [Brassica napus]|uniref:BnaAnng07860D protein n=1 Tax=Brassica napus TaxID=3708 RepID=A0A078I4U5_BRANA|nr:BnaAnng07860D [Brassica napus]